MTAKSPNKNSGFRVIGTAPIRHDATDKVTGQARYGADVTMPGILYGKILRSPYAHAKINSIDATKALALDGVKAVVTSADLPVLSVRPIDVAECAPLKSTPIMVVSLFTACPLTYVRMGRNFRRSESRLHGHRVCRTGR